MKDYYLKKRLGNSLAFLSHGIFSGITNIELQIIDNVVGSATALQPRETPTAAHKISALT
jgi:hypothetical protein